MILRKPYAFLIKHFKLIHFILVILLCINLYYSLGIVNFFNAYIANGYRATSTYNLVENYTPIIFMLGLLFSIIIPLILYILLSYKEKPKTIYMYIIIYYIILFALYFYIRDVFNILTNDVISSTLSRLIRDISIISLVPQIPFIIIVLIRSIGFDLKKFSFESDFKDMQLEYGDNEEVEVDLSFNGYKFKRKLRREAREFKYYLIENKFVVTIIAVIIIALIGYSIYSTIRPSYERRYSLGQTIPYKNFNIVIDDAMLTSVDYKGQTIKAGSYYVLLKVNVTNTLSVSSNFDFNVLKLQTKNGLLSPTQSLINYFADYGNPDISEYLLGEESRNYVVCFEVKSSEIDNNYRIVISNGSATFRGETYNRSIIVNISLNVNNYQKVHNYNLNDIVVFEDNFLKNNTLQITSYNITKRVRYTYDSCVDGNCRELTDLVTVSTANNRSNNYLLELKVNYENKTESKSYSSVSYLFEKHCLVEYVINNERKVVDVINVTPKNYNGVILEVPNEIRDAQSANIIIATRDNQYSISMK